MRRPPNSPQSAPSPRLLTSNFNQSVPRSRPAAGQRNWTDDTDSAAGKEALPLVLGFFVLSVLTETRPPFDSGKGENPLKSSVRPLAADDDNDNEQIDGIVPRPTLALLFPLNLKSELFWHLSGGMTQIRSLCS